MPAEFERIGSQNRMAAGLGYRLDERAYNAAKRIVFQPKMKDGKPVSTVVTLEYSFRMY